MCFITRGGKRIKATAGFQKNAIEQRKRRVETVLYCVL